MTQSFVAYHRVSTDKQGQSGLGLDAQRAAIAAYANASGATIVAEFTEVESGRRADRPELLKALAACRKHRATLLIAKLDRLARNVAFVAGLMENGVDFRAADIPNADRFMLHINAAVAEEEARKISQRTRAALAVAKKRGVKLGNPTRDTTAARATRQVNARQAAANLLPMIEAIRAAGAKSLADIAEALNGRGIKSPRGGRWYPAGVRRMIALVGK